MKKLSIIAALFAAFIISAPMASANPDLTDLLKNAASSLKGGSSSNESSSTSSSSSTALDGLKGLVEGLISKSNLTEADLVGEYRYSAPAVAFESSDLLKKAGGAAAAGVVESKIAPYYNKVGLDKLTATFVNDNTFKFQFNKVTLSGTYAKDASSENGDFTFSFMVGNKIPLGKMAAHVEKVGSKLTITFDVSKLITLINAAGSLTNASSVKTLASILNSYDGMQCGFELTPVK